jgi:hypothetical protein
VAVGGGRRLRDGPQGSTAGNPPTGSTWLTGAPATLVALVALVALAGNGPEHVPREPAGPSRCEPPLTRTFLCAGPAGKRFIILARTALVTLFLDRLIGLPSTLFLRRFTGRWAYPTDRAVDPALGKGRDPVHDGKVRPSRTSGGDDLEADEPARPMSWSKSKARESGCIWGSAARCP